MNILEKIALVFTIIGGINWGLVGIFDWNLVEAIFGTGSVVTRIVYIVVAVSALINILLLFMRLDESQYDYSTDYPRKRATN
ncbi:MAG: DUF378 domain-containing protein [Erysipelotrichales bacterium]|nr:DUF378 domain-containing protein [Erysipelotrichales bacterium]